LLAKAAGGWRTAVPHPLIRDPGLSSLKTAARAAIVMPAVFAFASKVIGQPQTALFAAFGSFSLLVLASFSGPPRSRLAAYLSLGVAGAALVTLGTLCSGNAWLAAGAMAVVGFGILLSGFINGYFAAGGTAAILAFVLAVAVPAPASAIPARLAGWGLAAAVGTLAVMLLWPPRDRATLRADAARACVVLAALAEALCSDPVAVASRARTARVTVNALRDRLTGTSHRPTGPAGPAVALAALIDELGWLCESLAALAASPAGELCAEENSSALRAIASVLRASGARLSGEPDHPGQGAELELTQEAAARALADRISASPSPPDDVALQTMLGRSFRIHSMSYTTRQIAGYAEAASAPAAWRPAGMLAVAGQGGLTGPLGKLRSEVRAAEDFGMTHSGVRSVWFRNSIRGAAGLAIAVFIAQTSGLQHSFWVVLGTLSVLRSNALGTGWTVLTALAGTAAGILVGAAILIPVHGDTTVLWAVLPVAVLIAAYAPRVISFAAGQAAFTVVVLILFNIIQPAGWKVGIVRIEDVAVGFAISLGVGLVFWPRGAAALVRENLAESYSRTADYVAAMVERLTGVDGGADPDQAGLAAVAAVHRLDDTFGQYLAERSAKRVDPEQAARLVAGAARVLRAGRSLAAIQDLAARRAVSQPDGSAGAALVLPDGLEPCAGQLEEEAQSIRAWFVTLGDSVAHGTALPPPQRRNPAARSNLLQCTRAAITSGQPAEAQDALLVLWVNEHLELLWRLERHLGRVDADREEPAPATLG
jgi:uncharacterized membrane protein YccC